MPDRENLIELIYASGMVETKTRCAIIADELIGNGVVLDKDNSNISSKWIPVTERLPEKVAPYLVLSKAGNCSVQWFHIYGENFKGFFHVEEPGKITHWMPLPQPPKGE